MKNIPPGISHPKGIGEAAPKFLGTAYYAVNGATRQQAIYTFPKREACLMAMSYSYECRPRVAYGISLGVLC